MNSALKVRNPRLGPLGAFAAGRPTLVFFILALGVSWAGWVPVAAEIVELKPLVFGLTVVGVLGPAVAAVLVTWLVGDSLRAWAQPIFRWRVPLRWYVVAFSIPVIVIATKSVAQLEFGVPLEQPTLVEQGPPFELPLIYAVNLLVLFFLGGGQEEPGWRGFALPRLLQQFDAATASLLLGAVWAIWHLPLFWTAGTTQANTAFIPYATGVLALSILFTWLYRNTDHSVLLAMIFHASVNGSTLLTRAQSNTMLMQWLDAATLWAIAIVIVAVYGRSLQSYAANAKIPSNTSTLRNTTITNHDKQKP